jgi:hypothetical protein
METRIEDLLRDDEPAILDEVAPSIERMEHYHRDGAEATRQRVEALYRHVARAVRARDLDDLLAHAARIARERFEAGFDLAEVQAAFSMIEEAIARRALSRLPHVELAWGLGLVSTALAHAKGELGRTYAALAPRSYAPGVDLTSLFKRTPERRRSRAADDLVYPV